MEMPQHAIKQSMQQIVESPIYNGLWFYALWFSAILVGDEHISLAMMFVVLHFLMVKDRLLELKICGSIAVIGMTIDGLLSANSVFIFTNDAFLPPWLLLLWIGFAASLSRSLKFLSSRFALAAAVGAIGGTLSYFSGMKFGAVSFGYSITATAVILMAIWAALLPLLFQLVRYLQRNHVK